MAPDLSVSFGAAIEGGLISSESLERILVDVTAHSPRLAAISNVTGEGRCAPVISRNSPIPARRFRTFYSASDNQKKVLLQVYQGAALGPRRKYPFGWARTGPDQGRAEQPRLGGTFL